MTTTATDWDGRIGIGNSPRSKFYAISISAQDDKQLASCLAEAVGGLEHAIPRATAARRNGWEVVEVAIRVGDWIAGKPQSQNRDLTFEELVAEYREAVA